MMVQCSVHVVTLEKYTDHNEGVQHLTFKNVLDKLPFIAFY